MDLDYFRADLMEMLTNPKAAFRRIINYEHNSVGIICLFITGIILAIKRITVINANFKLIEEMSTNLAVAQSQKDGMIAVAALLPVTLVALWFVISYITDIAAEKFGGFSGDLKDIQTAFSYISIFILIFELIIFPLFILEYTAHIKFMGTIASILTVIFCLWILYMGATAIEIVYGVPMSYGFIIFIAVTFLVMLFYYIVVDWVIGQIFIPHMRKGAYDTRF